MKTVIRVHLRDILGYDMCHFGDEGEHLEAEGLSPPQFKACPSAKQASTMEGI